MSATATEATTPARVRLSYGCYSEAAARADARDINACDAEVEARARSHVRLPAQQRATLRERLLRSVPEDVAADICEEFERADTLAVGLHSRRVPNATALAIVRPRPRERRTKTNASATSTGDDGDPDPAPRATEARAVPVGRAPSTTTAGPDLDFWRSRSPRPLTEEDGREISANLTQFFSVLIEWAEPQPPSASPATETATTSPMNEIACLEGDESWG